MARRVQSLNIWMNGLLVGEWEKTRSGELLRYFDEWIHHEQGRPLSLSLPFTPGNQAYRGAIVTSYFDNLLPDSVSIRSRLAQRFQTGSIEPFELLATLGRDCVGAIQLKKLHCSITISNGNGLTAVHRRRIFSSYHWAWSAICRRI